MTTDASPPGIHLGFTDEVFPAAAHMCYIFTDDRERRALITRFLARGVLDHEMIGYIADSITREELCSELEQAGVDAPKMLQNQQLYMDSVEHAYCPNGQFCISSMLQKLRDFHADARQQCFSSARMTGEMHWVLSSQDRLRLLIEYETQLTRLIRQHPVMGICQYDANLFSGDLLHDVLEIHPFMIIRGQVVRNPYCIEPDVGAG